MYLNRHLVVAYPSIALGVIFLVDQCGWVGGVGVLLALFALSNSLCTVVVLLFVPFSFFAVLFYLWDK